MGYSLSYHLAFQVKGKQWESLQWNQMKHSKWKVPSNQVAPVFNKKNLHCACKTQIKKYIPTYMSGAVTCLFCSSSAQANVSHKGTFPLNNLNIKFAFMNSSWLVTKEFLILFLRFWAVFCFHYLSLLDLFFPLFPLAPTVLSQSPHWHPGPTHQTCVVLTSQWEPNRTSEVSIKDSENPET